MKALTAEGRRAVDEDTDGSPESKGNVHKVCGAKEAGSRFNCTPGNGVKSRLQTCMNFSRRILEKAHLS